MKNLIYLLFIILSTSCSNSDDKPENNLPQELIEKWKIVKVFETKGVGKKISSLVKQTFKMKT